jgi:hypothetical protein
MSLKVVPTDSGNEKQHRTVIATAANELIKARHPYDRTGAEGSANIGPRDAAYLPGNILRQGAQSAQNSATAINETISQSEIGFGNFGGAATYIPFGRYLGDARIEITATTTLHGDGYASTIQLPTSSTHIALLVQDDSFTEILGVRLRDFRIDGNGGGQLDAALVQINNAVGFVVDGLWLANGDRVSGSSGVNGIGCSVGSLDATGRPQGVISSCFVEEHSKGAYNVTTQCDGVAVVFNIARNGAGTNIVPAYQVNGAQNTRLIGNLSYNHEGHALITATDGNDEPPGYTIAAFNVFHDFGTGTSAADGSGHAHTNISSTNFGRCLYAFNTLYDGGKGSAGGSPGVSLQNDSRISLSHYYIYDVGLHGVAISGTSNTMEDIRVCDMMIENINSKNNAIGACVHVQGTVKKVTVSRNHGFNSSGTSCKYFLYIDNAAVIEDLVVEDNDVYGMATANYHWGTGGATITRFRIRIEGRHQTDDTSQDTVFAFPLPDNSACFLKVSAVGIKSDGTERAAYERSALIYRDGGGATIEGGTQTSLFSQETDASYDASISVSGNLMVFLIRGNTGDTVNWRWKVEAYSI